MNYGSLRQDVRRLSDQGRFGDSMMMHVNPIEVAALDSMVPGGLTRNPATGQPEAWLPLIGLALGATIGGATAKKRKQSILEGILMGGGMGLLGGMGAGALAGGAAGAGGAGAAAAAANSAAAAAPAAGAASAAPGVYSTVAGPLASALQGGQAVGAGTVLAPAQSAALLAPAQSAAQAFTGLHGAAGTPGLGVLNPEALAAAQASTPMSAKASNLAATNLANASHVPLTPGEAFTKGAGDRLEGYGGNLKKGLGVMADNPMMTMGGAMMLDQVMNDEEEEKYGEYDGPLAYGSWRHGGAG